MTPRGEAAKAARVDVREELNQATATLIGGANAAELETRLEALTRMFGEGAP